MAIRLLHRAFWLIYSLVLSTVAAELILHSLWSCKQDNVIENFQFSPVLCLKQTSVLKMTRFARYSGSNQKFYKPAEEIKTDSDVKKLPYPIKKRNLKSKKRDSTLVNANFIALNHPQNRKESISARPAISRGIAAELTKYSSSNGQGKILCSCHIKNLVNTLFALSWQERNPWTNLVVLKRYLKREVKSGRKSECQTK